MKSPKDILALGQAIVRQLELDERGAVLERWLAHHLAEVLSEADRATGTDKAAAEQRAVALILKLWMHRRALPDSVDPLGGYRNAIAVLSRLMPEADPWAQYRRHGTYEDVLHEMFECMSRVMLGGILLTQVSCVHTVTDAERKALESEEAFLLKALEEWMPFVQFGQQLLEVEVKLAGPDAGNNEQQDASTEADLHDVSIGEKGSGVEGSVRLAMIENLERMQKNLGDLLVRWKAASLERCLIDEDEGGRNEIE